MENMHTDVGVQRVYPIRHHTISFFISNEIIKNNLKTGVKEKRSEGSLTSL